MNFMCLPSFNFQFIYIFLLFCFLSMVLHLFLSLIFLTMLYFGTCLFRRAAGFQKRETSLVVIWIQTRFLLQKTKPMVLVLACLGSFQAPTLHF